MTKDKSSFRYLGLHIVPSADRYYARTGSVFWTGVLALAGFLALGAAAYALLRFIVPA